MGSRVGGVSSTSLVKSMLSILCQISSLIEAMLTPVLREMISTALGSYTSWEQVTYMKHRNDQCPSVNRPARLVNSKMTG